MRKRLLAIALSVAMMASAFVFPTSAAKAGDLLLYYNFKDIENNVIADRSGNGYDTTLPAVDVDNGDGTVTLNDGGGIDFPAEVFAGTEELTMSFYINQPLYQQTTNLLSYGPDKDHLMTVLLGHDNVPGPRLAICNGSEADGQEKFYCQQQIEQGAWTLVTFVISEGKLTRYIDGIEYASVNKDGGELDGTITMTPANIYDTAVAAGVQDSIPCKLGGPTAWADPSFKGSVGAFKVFGTALSEDEVLGEFEAFKAGGDGLTNDSGTATGLKLSSDKLSVEAGKSANLTATIEPAGTLDAIVWKSSEPGVATVVGGKVTGVKAGTSLITASLASQPGIMAYCTVTVTAAKPIIKPAVSSVKLSSTKATLTVKKTTTLKATVAPANAAKVSWKSSNSSVASVSGGKVTAKAAGKATITATAGGKSAKCTITVKPGKPTKVKLSKSGKKLVVKFKKGAGAKYAQVVIYRNNKKVKTANNVKKTSYKYSAKKKGTYKARVYSCAKVSKSVYKSGYASSKKVKVK